MKNCRDKRLTACVLNKTMFYLPVLFIRYLFTILM